jgi:hypothetical protein
MFDIISNIIDYLLGSLTQLFGNNAEIADDYLLNFLNFTIKLSNEIYEKSVPLDFNITNNALTNSNFPNNFIFTDIDPEPGMNATGENTTTYITNLNNQLTKAKSEIEGRVIIFMWYLSSGFLHIASMQTIGKFSNQIEDINTSVTGLNWKPFWTSEFTTNFNKAIMDKNAINVVVNSPLNGIIESTITNRSIIIQLIQDILDD